MAKSSVKRKAKPTWPRVFKRFSREDQGVSVVEFAIAIPVALMMLFAVVEFGRAIFSQVVLLYAAEEATRWGIVNYDATPDQIQDYARTKISLASLQDSAVIVATNPEDPTTLVRTVNVSITAPFQLAIPFGNLAPITLGANSDGFEVPPPGDIATPVQPEDTT